MTTRLDAFGVLLAADDGAHTLTYRLLPFGEPGRTSLGTVTAAPGVVALPDDPGAVVLNMEHDPLAPVGRAVSLVEDAAGLVATFDVAPTTRGRDLLTEAAAGLRTGVSVELADVVIRGGRLLAARLVGAGAVVAPAFPSALLVASDTPDDVDDPADDPADSAPGDDAAAPDAPDADGADETTDTPEESVNDSTLTAAAAPSAVVPAGGASRRPLSIRDAASLYAAVHRGEPADLTAALSDVPYTGNDAAMPPQWVGELWDGITYVRDVVDAITPGTLTSGSLSGWKWNPRPTGADYAGDKGAIPSPAAGIDPVSQGIHRFAGGHDFDRIFVDLGDASVIESYFREQANDYAAWSNAHATADLVAAAGTPLTNADPLTLLVNVATAIKGGPTFIAMASDVAAALMLVNKNLPFLAGSLLLSGQGEVGGGGLFIGQELSAGTILAGRRESATFFEPAGSPLRVRAVDVAKGGEDAAVFGYCATLVRRPGAFKVGTLTTTP